MRVKTVRGNVCVFGERGRVYREREGVCFEIEDVCREMDCACKGCGRESVC